MIGIITPLYNDEKRIQKAIKSVEQQQSVDFIHYICDDCSTDSSFNVVLKYGNPNIRIFSTEINSGPSAARNVCIEQALKDQVDYIAFLDSDDSWEPGHLKNLLSQIEDNDFICSSANFFDEDKNPLEPTDNDISFEALVNGNKIYSPTILLKSAVVSDIGKFDSMCDSLEDWDFWLRIAKAGYKMKKISDKTANYLVRNNSMASKSRNAKFIVMSKYKPLKLNLGCGTEYLPDYVNCDLYDSNALKADMIFDAAKIPFYDNSIEEIRAYHLIEHFNYMQIWDVLKEWYRVLKPNGKLVLETPDLLNTCKKFVESDEQTRISLYGHFFAYPWIDVGQTHYFLFTESQLFWTLSQVGFKRITRLEADSIYANSSPDDWKNTYLKVIAEK